MGLINLYNSFDNTKQVLHGNGKIKDILANININNAVIIKAGNRINSDYEVTENDVLLVRLTPGGASAATVIAITVSAVALGVGVGAAIYANNKTRKLQDKYENSQADLSVQKLPFLKGANNQSALGKTIPYVMGEMYFTPYKLNNGFYSISGNNGETQFYNVPLVCGYNNQVLKSVSIGNTKIKDFDTTDEAQDNVYHINHSTYGNIDLEVSNNGELTLDGLNQKVVGQYYGEEVKHNFGSEAEPVIEQLAENPMRVEVCIKFDGLRAYDTDTGNYVEKTVKIVPYWSNNASADNPVWNSFTFDIKNNAASYEWHELTDSELASAINSGYIIQYSKNIPMGINGYYTVTAYRTNSSEYSVTCNNELTSSYTFKKRELISNDPNKIIRNTNKTCRFVASRTFTPAEAYGKSISIKVVKETVTEDSNTNETCILEYINTYCYDSVKSTSTNLVACSPLEQPFRDQVLRLGLKFEANSNTDKILNEINIITCAKARIWNGAQWTDTKAITRNPAAWLLDVLLSEYHNNSKYDLSEINLNSLGSWYEYCNTNELYCDGVLTEGIKKEDLLGSILTLGFADLIINDEGLLEVVIDKKEITPVALINEQNITSITYAKTFERKITGEKTTYTNRNDWNAATEYFFKQENHSYNQLTDTLHELALDYCTTHNHAYKLAQRVLRQRELQPRTITVNVGMEGDYYPLYSTVLLQSARFKQGITSTVIHEVIKNSSGAITGFKLADAIEFVSDYRYGVIVQAQSDNGKNLFYAEITGSGKTRNVTLVSPKSNTITISRGNIASIGLLNQDGSFTSVTNTMKITGISPASNHGWELTLKDYDEAIYEYGTIPEYKSNLTRRPTTAKTLPTVKAVDVDSAKYANWTETKQLVAGLEARMDTFQTDTTNCELDRNSCVFDVDANGVTLTEQSVSINISLKHNDDELDFIIDPDKITKRNGLSYSVNGKKLTITVGEGVSVKANFIAIPVEYYAVVSSKKYVAANGKYYVTADGKYYANTIFSDTKTTYTKYFNFMASGFCTYLGSFSSLSQIPANTNIGDFFTWSGTNRQQSSLAYDGYFLQACVYKYVGDSKAWAWEKDTNSGHAQSALSDVLDIANADLQNNNSTVWAYLDHLTSNSVYCGMLVANEAFIEQLAAKVVTADLVTTSQLSTSLEAYEKVEDLNATLDGYYTKTAIDGKGYDTVTARNTALNEYIKSTSIFGNDGKPLSTFATDSINNAIVNGQTVIKNGFINTNALSADVVTTNYLETGDATFKGVISLINDSTAGIDSYIISSNYIADNIKGLKIYEDANKKGIVETGVLKATTITSNKSEYGGYKALNFSCRTRFDAIVSFDTITSFFAENNSSQDTLYYGLGRVSQDCEARYLVGQGFVKYGTTSIDFSLMKVLPDSSVNGYRIYIPYVSNNDAGILEFTYTSGQDHIKHGSTNVTKLYFYGV